jgi:CheY-like chemotaxis protein
VTDRLDRLSPEDQPIVLVVEDDDLLRDLATAIVELAGFVALEAGDANEALAMLEGGPDISLLFTDINMPGPMDGLELAHVVRHRRPFMKILVASSMRVQPCQLPSNSRFVRKPYAIVAMVEELQSLFGRSTWQADRELHNGPEWPDVLRPMSPVSECRKILVSDNHDR